MRQETQSHTDISYQLVSDKVYAFGATETRGLLQMDLTNLTISLVQTTGSEPPSHWWQGIKPIGTVNIGNKPINGKAPPLIY